MSFFRRAGALIGTNGGQTRLYIVLPNNRFERDAAKNAAPLKRNVRLSTNEC
jgi:hypothetical protein